MATCREGGCGGWDFRAEVACAPRSGTGFTYRLVGSLLLVSRTLRCGQRE